MFRVGTNIIGIGSQGCRAVNAAITAGVTGGRYITLMGDDDSKAEFVLDSKSDFMQACDKLFMATNGVTFVAADASDRVSAALACEICAVSRAMRALTVAVVYVPSSRTDNYEEARGYVDELHGVCNGVVIVNQGYAADFGSEVCMLLEALSNAMDSAGSKRISGADELRAIFDTPRDIFFAAVQSDVLMDSHGYLSDNLSLKLDCQTHIDIASNITYLVSCGSQMPKALLSQYVNAVDKKNIAYMSNKKAYVYENNPRFTCNGFMFAVLCSQ
ncbi:MAG: hypothetical protein IJ365_08500 [Clostridia bacterium]|nr:hypothetical protein [Clostridia bacterium]